MFVERIILATLPQQNEHQCCLAYCTRELPVDTPATEYPICRQIMQGIVVPNIHSEVCLCSSIVCPNPIVPSTEQIVNHGLHVHTHIISRVSRNYQRQEYVLSLEDDAGGKIEGDNENVQQVYGAADIPYGLKSSVASATRTLRASSAF